MARRSWFALVTVVLAGVSLAAAKKPLPPMKGVAGAIAKVSGEEILRHIRILASDEYAGRAPGTAGEELTVNYIAGEFKKLGLRAPGGSYLQNVPMLGLTIRPTASILTKGERSQLRMPEDFVAVTRRVAPTVSVKDSDVIFVGYGVVAPEFGWDDYKGVDVRGKTILMLINDPPVTRAGSSELDPAVFKGKAMTYYGRWTYKYEIAAEKGAAAAIIIHETAPAGYPYSTVSSGRMREQLQLKTDDNGASLAAVEAWMSLDSAKDLLAKNGKEFESLKAAAARPDFKPVPLDAKASFDLNVSTREFSSRNVVSVLDGSDPQLKSECVIYSAHWDGYGVDETLQGDQIKNGALDNGSGVAELLEIARAFTRLPSRPKRSIVFFAPTAEESNLLGAQHYVRDPVFPLEKTLAIINMDMMNVWGRTHTLVSIGYPNTTLEDLLEQVAAGQGRRVIGDPESEKGFFYRSDHLEFMKQGVPALTFLHSGLDYVGKPNGYGTRKRREYNERDYHSPSDEVKPDWELGGAVDDVRALFEVGYRVAQGSAFPQWKEGTEFKARREESLKRPTP